MSRTLSLPCCGFLLVAAGALLAGCGHPAPEPAQPPEAGANASPPAGEYEPAPRSGGVEAYRHHAGHHGGGLAQRFAAANVTHDGRLTLAQAEAGGMRLVAHNFDRIDVEHRGYVTVDEIRSWFMAHRDMFRHRAHANGANGGPASTASPAEPSENGQ